MKAPQGQGRGNRRLALAGAALLALWAVAAALAPWIAPFDPFDQPDIVNGRLLSPSAEHWLGTDALSRDILSRLLHGARLSLAAGFAAMTLSVGIGTLFGAAAGFLGGRVDAWLMRLVDLLLCVPPLVLLLVTLGTFSGERSLFAIVLVLGLSSWMSTSRLVRAEILSLKERDFAQAAQAMGVSKLRLIFRHLLPNCAPTIAVAAGISLGGAILWESSLAFLGLGLAAPAPAWGTMIAEGLLHLGSHPWGALVPGIAVTLVIFAAHLVAEGLRDFFDSKTARA